MNLKEYIKIQLDAMKQEGIYEAEFDVHLDKIGMVCENYNGNRIQFKVNLRKPRKTWISMFRDLLTPTITK